MLFFWVLRWVMLRSLAILAGGALYLYIAVKHPTVLRQVQVYASQLSSYLATQVPVEYAVWLPALNLGMSLTFLGFILVAMLVVDAIWRIIRICVRGVGYATTHLKRRH